LLKDLTEQFVASEFDLKHLIRSICNSEAYQRTSKVGDDEVDPALFSHMAVKVMTPEQLFDSLQLVVGRLNGPQGGRNAPAGARGPGGNARGAFVNFFNVAQNAPPTESQAGTPQALRLMNSAQMNNGGPALTEALKAGKDPAQVVEKLFLATLARRPTAAEAERMTAYVKKRSDERKAYADVLWVLVNT